MQKYYYELIIKPKQENFLFEDYISFIYDEAIEFNQGMIILRSNERLENILIQIKEFAKKNNFEFEYVLEKKENKDWFNEYKKNITPIQIDKFYIYPSWENPKKDLINIILEPTLAFGSGHHETTSSCIKAISKEVGKKDFVLDVGCGSGILGLACAKLGAKVELCDTDELAVKNATENFKLNNESFNNIWVGSVNKSNEKYDVIIANIVADILIMLKNDFKKHLKENGKLILSGILNIYEDKVLDSFKEFKIKEKIYKNEWITLILVK